MSLLQILDKKTATTSYTVGRVYYSEGGYSLAHNGKKWRILLFGDVVLTEKSENFEEIREALEFKPFQEITVDDYDDGAEWKEKELENRWYLESIGLHEEAAETAEYDVLGYFSEFADEYIGDKEDHPEKYA